MRFLGGLDLGGILLNGVSDLASGSGSDTGDSRGVPVCGSGVFVGGVDGVVGVGGVLFGFFLDMCPLSMVVTQPNARIL